MKQTTDHYTDYDARKKFHQSPTDKKPFHNKNHKNYKKKESVFDALLFPKPHVNRIDIPSKGKPFKLRYGFSKSMKRNMDKYRVMDSNNIKTSLAEYRRIRLEKKKELAKVRKLKHEKSVMIKRTKSASKTKPGTKKAA